MCPASGEQNVLGLAQVREHSARAGAGGEQRLHGGGEVEMGLHGCWGSFRQETGPWGAKGEAKFLPGAAH